jgi:hypothetical protein
MRHVLFILFVASIFSVTPAFAQSEPTREPSPSMLAYVEISGATLVREGRTMTTSFTLTNQHGVQPGVRYGVVLVHGEGDDAYIADEYTYDEELTLREGEARNRAFVYTVPKALRGDFTLYVTAKNSTGFTYGLTRAGTLSLDEVASASTLNTKSCYLTVTGKTTKLDQMKPVHLKEGETLMSHCVVTNEEPGSITLTPRYETRTDSLFGSLAYAEGGSSDTITLGARETKTLATPLPRATAPGAYVVTLAYDGDGNDITYAYTIGEQTSIENVFLGSDSYRAGDRMNVSAVLSGNGTYTYVVEVINDQGESCTESVYQSLTLSGTARIDVPLSLTTLCTDPQITHRLTDTTNRIVAESVTTITTPKKTLDQGITMSSVVDTGLKFGSAFFVCIIALAIGLGVLYYSLYRKGKMHLPKAPLVLLFVLGVCIFGAPQAHGASFTQNDGACYVTTNETSRSGLPFPRTGEPIDVFVSSNCAGITVTGALQNGGGGFTGTTNNLGYFYTSYSAPPTDDTMWYITGDWTRSAFGGDTQPWSPIFVNRCIPATINNCTTAGGAYFGATVGETGGTCIASGSCSYTCQSDLTWQENSNTCGAPPPPPPGSAPEFTSTPSCVIAANASSCTATVSVFVPSLAFSAGADLKLCDGTYLQTISPGNQTVSVTIPYDSACLNLHVSAFIAMPAADSITGTATCVAGTNWNGSVCAPLPPPGTPTGLGTETWGTCGAKTIKVTWNPAPGATSYDILRNGPTGQLISSVASPFIDTVADGSTHTYQVRAWNTSGPSAWSSPIQGTAPDACLSSGALTVTTCAIPAGQSTCSATIAWTTTNAVAPSVLQGGVSFSTSPSSGGTLRPVPYGTNVFTLQNGGTILETENVFIGCASGTTWNGTQCESPSVPPSTRPCAGTELLGCQLDPAPHGGTDGTCNPAAFTGTCDYTCNDGTWGAPSTNSCTAIVAPPVVVSGPPTLTTPSRIVNQGTVVPIQWDTNNGNEGLCTLTGGTLSGYITPNSGDGVETGSVSQTINGRTTYTLVCPSGTTTLTIDIIPKSSET